MALTNSLAVLFIAVLLHILTKLLQQCFLFFTVIPGHNLAKSQVSVYRTIGPTLVVSLSAASPLGFFTPFLRVRLFTQMDRHGLNYQTGLPEWTFICGFECLLCILYAQNGLQMPQRVESTSSMHFKYHKKLKLTSYCVGWR